MTKVVVHLTVLLVAVLGCQSGLEISSVGSRDGGAAPPVSTDGARPSADAPNLGGPGFPDAPPATTPPPPDKCAEEAHMAERVPVDLMLLIDRSSSMNTKTANGKTKWQMAQEALTAFIGDPKSDGLGVGMEFFPVPSDGRCMTDIDCGFPRDIGQFCAERRACVGAGGLPAVPVSCGSIVNLDCPTGTPCVPLGRCAITGANCVGIGQPCPGGQAGNTCVSGGKSCVVGLNDSCRVEDYQKPAVPFGDLPGSRAALTNALAMTMTAGGTPTEPAVQGALDQLRRRGAGRRGALVLVTDGVPSACSMADPLATVTAQITAARTMTPSIATYAIGVFGATEGQGGPMALRGWAMAGGTGMPFVLTPTDDLTQRLLEALNQIRGAALACEYKIPPSTMAGMIDFKKLNLHFKGTSGEEDIGYVGRADRCDPVRGGWYYDVDPDLGTPTRVIVCDATCRRFKADAAGRVELRFGCKTKVIE